MLRIPPTFPPPIPVPYHLLLPSLKSATHPLLNIRQDHTEPLWHAQGLRVIMFVQGGALPHPTRPPLLPVRCGVPGSPATPPPTGVPCLGVAPQPRRLPGTPKPHKAAPARPRTDNDTKVTVAPRLENTSPRHHLSLASPPVLWWRGDHGGRDVHAATPHYHISYHDTTTATTTTTSTPKYAAHHSLREAPQLSLGKYLPFNISFLLKYVYILCQT